RTRWPDTLPSPDVEPRRRARQPGEEVAVTMEAVLAIAVALLALALVAGFVVVARVLRQLGYTGSGLTPRPGESTRAGKNGKKGSRPQSTALDDVRTAATAARSDAAAAKADAAAAKAESTAARAEAR